MKTSYYCFVIVLQILCWVSATNSRPFPPNDALGVYQAGPSQIPESSQLISPEGLKSTIDEAAKMNEVASYRGFSRIGSSPPSCDNKCYGCTPCEAIQVPTTKKHNTHFRVQYANYEPEGWKCKCGPTFYSP